MPMQIHRFRDKVALYVSRETVYLTPTQAKAIAKALNGAAKSIKTEPDFCNSNFATVVIE